MKVNRLIWIGIAIAIVVLLSSSGVKLGKKAAGESLERVLSSNSVQPGGSFTLKYRVLNAGSTPFFFSIKDTMSGGCTIFGSSEVVTTLSSPAGETGAMTITAPSSEGTCTFTGDWQLGSGGLVQFTTQTVTVQTSGTCSGVCKSNACSSYPSCSSASGTCTSGYCCSGTCILCTAHASSACDGGDLYWYNSCGVKEDIKQDCGTGTCSLGACISACAPNWQCGSWSTCSVSCSQTRTCNDANTCGVPTGKPAESQTCTGGSCVQPAQTCTAAGYFECSSSKTCSDIKSGYQTTSGYNCCGSSGACTTVTQTCAQAGYYECPVSKTCNSLVSGYAASSGVCCASAASCVSATPVIETCEEKNSCEFFEECNKTGDGCTVKVWIFYALGLLAFLVIVPPLLRG